MKMENNTPFIQKAVKEFEKKYSWVEDYDAQLGIEDFLITKLTELLDEVEKGVPKVRDLERTENTAVNRDPAVAFNHGFNVCRGEVITHLKGLRG